MKFIQHDMNLGSLDNIFVDAIYLIDVIEHVDPEKEDRFIKNMIASYENKENAVMIIGTPNLAASKYASAQSTAVHINLKSQNDSKALLYKYFNNVFMFGMNDEVVHTGYGSMCHYIWGVACGLRDDMSEKEREWI